MDASSKRRVLIADDLDDAASSLGMVFELHGCAVRLCRSGAEVVQAAIEFRPHLLLLDLDFGAEPDGYEVARRVRNEPTLRGVTIAAITGWGRASDRAEAAAAGFDHFFVKPTDPSIVVDLALAIDRRRDPSGSWPADRERRAGPADPAPGEAGERIDR